MIYDCFPFYNELDVLEIRLHELNSVVDKFVLVEATRTFQKKDKPLFFEENKKRFEKFLPKIEHVIVDKFPGFFYKWRIPHAWDYDNYQKDQVVHGLKKCSDEDVIIISDVDEIPSSRKIEEYKNIEGIKVFEQMLSNYYFNFVSCKCPDEDSLIFRDGVCFWKGSVMMSYKNFSAFKEARKMRNRKDGVINIENGGWHFSFVGNFERIRTKLESWAHTKEAKYNPSYLNDEKAVMAIVSSGKDLFGRDYLFKKMNLDHRFPEYLVNNREKYSQLLVD